MCNALRENELDIAIALTEGVISDIVAGNPSRIIQFFVNSPLRWGIYTSVKNPIHHLSQIAGKRYAISRYKSGSHLMAFVNARNLGFSIEPNNDFVVVGNIDGARKSLANLESDVFMWEKYMTKPLVDSGEFRFLGECSTPWPCFAVVASNKILQEDPAIVVKVMEVVNNTCYNLKYREQEATKMVAWRYNLKLADAQQWFSELEYNYNEVIDEIQLTGILNDLKSLGIIDTLPALETICYSPNLMSTEDL
jgi:ABC-type nitrate/sulfonate/bicarbonate transport system substrate-binding protein